MVSKIRDLLKPLPRKGGGRRAPLSPTLSSRICLVLLRAVENEPKRLLDRLLGKILQKSQEDPAAASIKRAGSAGVLRETPVPIAAPSPPLGDSRPRGCPSFSHPPSRRAGVFSLLENLLDDGSKGQLHRQVQGTGLQPPGSLLV